MTLVVKGEELRLLVMAAQNSDSIHTKEEDLYDETVPRDEMK
jgi:hypothetical protein